MLGAWSLHPGYFVLLSSLTVIFVLFIGVLFFKTREFKHKERMEFIARGQPVIFSFSEKLLRYVPWQFWASSSILVLLIGLFLVCTLNNNLQTTSTTVLEIIKFVTGATIGALFGKNSVAAPSGGTPKQVTAAQGLET